MGFCKNRGTRQAKSPKEELARKKKAARGAAGPSGDTPPPPDGMTFRQSRGGVSSRERPTTRGYEGKRAATRQYLEYGEEPHGAADSVQSPLEGDKSIGLTATWNKSLTENLRLLERISKLAAGLEFHGFLGSNLDFLAGLRIAALAGGPFGN